MTSGCTQKCALRDFLSLDDCKRTVLWGDAYIDGASGIYLQLTFLNPNLNLFQYKSSTMGRCFVTGLLLYGLAFALPGSDEALQPCGGAFYYPSKV